MSAGTDHGGTDLGRRIREHRHQAGLTQEEAAARAGMAPGYLGYLETSPAAGPTLACVMRLAAALGTTREALDGAGLGLPPGQQAPLDHPVLETLTAAECRGYLANSGVGRLVFRQERGPVAFPVNYAMLGDDIVFRTDSQAAASAERQRVSFEVDHLDETLAEGWSVLLSGDAAMVTTPAGLDQARSLTIAPWAGPGLDTYVRLIAHDITGRRIRASGHPPGPDHP
jgi:transcriptional regulator with XRE-family HTH domain